MDLNALVRLIFLEKNDITFGVLIGLTLIVVILLLVRSVIDEKENATSGGTASLDSKAITTAIEGALKKAIASGAVVSAGVGAGAADGGVAGGSADSAELKKVLSEREAKIASLLSDLEVLKSQADSVSGGAKAGGAAGSGGDNEALLAKINELQAKLSEYEIIEDDIADLSSYKEENKKLKSEIEKLRVATATAHDQVQATQQTVDAPTPTAAVQSAQAAVLDVKPPTPATPSPAAAKQGEPFVLDTSDDVMGEFAKALTQPTAPSAATTTEAAPTTAPAASPVDEVSNLVVSGSATVNPQAAIDALLADSAKASEKVSEAAKESVAPSAAPAAEAVAAKAETDADAEAPSDPFGTLDTEKMLAEVASMGESSGTGDSSSVLDEQLDTDRLMAEMGIAEAPKAAEDVPQVPATAAIPTPPPAQAPVEVPEPAAPSVIAAPTPAASQVPVDDLLAEFNDTEFQTKK